MFSKKLFSKFANAPQPKVAMMMCIQNEERFLDANLRYHRALGVSRAYVFLDRCDDASLQIARSHAWVEPVVVNDMLHTISPFYPDLFRICADFALRMARVEGFDWLLSFDVDEFVFANHHSGVREWHFDLTSLSLEQILRIGHLPTMLTAVSPKYEAVFVDSLNVAPVQLEQDAPFWKHQFFHLGKVSNQLMCDPLTGETLVWSGSVASAGKSMVRTSADIQCFGSHEWVRMQNVDYPKRPFKQPIPTKKHGFLHHYYMTSPSHWREKYQKLSRELTLWHAGHPVGFPKQCGKRASAVLTDDEIDIYLNEWVYTSTKELNDFVDQMLVRKSDIVEKVLTNVDVTELENSPLNRVALDKVLTQFREAEQQAIANKSTKKSPTPSKPKRALPQQNKKLSGQLPSVSCVCVTQGQLTQLEEAIFSFLQQDYLGEKELVILNDNPRQTLEYEHPSIHIFNLTEQFSEPSHKRNTAVSLCTHDLIFIWDDDGIYLPHSISHTVNHFGKWKGFFKPTQAFVHTDGALRLPKKNIFHSGTCFTRKAFDKIRGYTFNEQLYFYKEEIESQLERKHAKLIQHFEIDIEDIFYIYKWAGIKAFQKKNKNSTTETIHGRIKLHPHWETNYTTLVRDLINQSTHAINQQS